MNTLRALLSLGCALSAAAIVNGLGVKPPMGWRSWKWVSPRPRRGDAAALHARNAFSPTPLPSLYGADVNQQLIQGIMTAMTSRRNTVDGVPTSLLDLGCEAARAPAPSRKRRRSHAFPLPPPR